MINEVVNYLLENAHYKKLQIPFHVSEMEFEVEAALYGPDSKEELVIIVETKNIHPRLLCRNLANMATVISRQPTPRPLTLIIIGKGDYKSVKDELKAYCRTIFIDEIESYKEKLHSLTPLQLPSIKHELYISWEKELRQQNRTSDTDLRESLIRSAKKDEYSVAQTMRLYLENAVKNEITND